MDKFRIYGLNLSQVLTMTSLGESSSAEKSGYGREYRHYSRYELAICLLNGETHGKTLVKISGSRKQNRVALQCSILITVTQACLSLRKISLSL